MLENYSCNFEAKPETEKEAFFRKLSWDEKVKVVVVGARSPLVPLQSNAYVPISCTYHGLPFERASVGVL